MQPTWKGPLISKGRLETITLQTHLYAYTNANVMDSTLNVVACQLSLAFYDVYAIFYSGATYSFISPKLALSISSVKDRTQEFLRHLCLQVRFYYWNFS